MGEAESSRGSLPAGIPLPLEVRVHGRGGQGGVTCAKLIATVYAEQGLHVQTFGDYGSERTGAPVRAFARVDTVPIRNHNKVYRPHHLVVLDAALLGDDVLEGAEPGAVVLLNTARGLEPFADKHGHFRFAAVDATAIARRHGIGTSAVVIINTTLAGAYARAMGLPWEAVERAFAVQGLERDLPAAREAWEAVQVREADDGDGRAGAARGPSRASVIGIAEHVRDIPTPAPDRLLAHPDADLPLPRRALQRRLPGGQRRRGLRPGARTRAASRRRPACSSAPSRCRRCAGRVCPAPCMSACNRGAYDGAVNIRGLERWIGDHVRSRPARPAPAAHPRRVAVVGSGPAGLGAAFALATAGHEVDPPRGRDAAWAACCAPASRPTGSPRRSSTATSPASSRSACRPAPGPSSTRGGVAALAASHDAVILAAGLPRLTGLDAPGVGPPRRPAGHPVPRRREARRRRRASPAHVVVVGGGNTAIDCARTALRLRGGLGVHRLPAGAQGDAGHRPGDRRGRGRGGEAAPPPAAGARRRRGQGRSRSSSPRWSWASRTRAAAAARW